MFKVSQDIYLNSCDSANHSKTYGKFKSVEEDDTEQVKSTVKVFVSPELSEIRKIQVLHFPKEPVSLSATVDFIVKKNNTRGNVEVKLRYPTKGVHTIEVPLQVIDPDRFSVQFRPEYTGQMDVIVKFNGVEIPQSPLKLTVKADNFTELPASDSRTHLIKAIGLGLRTVSLTGVNEFTVDASKAGINILFVGICGPNGQCDEVAIKHTGKNIYTVKYRVKDVGQYMIVAKWGDDIIPGSPFHLTAQ